MDEMTGEAVEWDPRLDADRQARVASSRMRFEAGATVFRKAREVLGLTQIEAAARMAITQAGYSKAERRAPADLEQLRRMAEGTGYEVVVSLRRGDECIEILP